MSETRAPAQVADSQPDKFREMLLYVARRTEGDPRCGRTKLNKILFYADFELYRRAGRSISGQKYQKLQFGPAPRGLLPAVEKLEASGACAWAARKYHGYDLQKLIPLREPDLSLFSGEEVDLINSVIEEHWQRSATEVSDLSHEFAGWQAAELGEDIPYETVHVGPPRPLTPEEEEWAAGVVEAYLERQQH